MVTQDQRCADGYHGWTNRETTCELCSRRKVQKRRCGHPRPHCRTCCRFIAEFIDTGLIPRRPVPMIADVFLVMDRLGVSRERAVFLLGGAP